MTHIIRAILLIFFIVSNSIVPPTLAADYNGGISKEDSYKGEVSYIARGGYYPAVKKSIREARESIYMVMYLAALNPNDKSSPVYELVNELIDAKKRGVDVKVILDRNIESGKIEGRYKVEDKNAWSYKLLKDAGIDARYDDPQTTSHAKAIVIDGETAILGSSNWSRAAFDKNFETNVLIRSKEFARKLLEAFKDIKIDEDYLQHIPGAFSGVPVSWKFLEDKRFAGRMITKHDERAFDLYLVLLKEFDGNPDGIVAVNYEEIASMPGLADTMTKEAYRREINRTLRKLEREYHLISFKPRFGKDAIAALLSYDDKDRPYISPKESYFNLPLNFWEFEWPRRLSMRAKFSYLINLAYAGISDTSPWWSSSLSDLAKRFNAGEWVISKGMQELRRQNLIDVLYDERRGYSYEERRAKSYKVLALYDPIWLEGEWDRLGTAYGLENLKGARRYAEAVFKENDPEAIEDIIKMMNSDGEKMVREAFAVAARKEVDNPKRCYAYVKGIMDRLRVKE